MSLFGRDFPSAIEGFNFFYPSKIFPYLEVLNCVQTYKKIIKKKN